MTIYIEKLTLDLDISEPDDARKAAKIQAALAILPELIKHELSFLDIPDISSVLSINKNVPDKQEIHLPDIDVETLIDTPVSVAKTVALSVAAEICPLDVGVPGTDDDQQENDHSINTWMHDMNSGQVSLISASQARVFSQQLVTELSSHSAQISYCLKLPEKLNEPSFFYRFIDFLLKLTLSERSKLVFSMLMNLSKTVSKASQLLDLRISPLLEQNLRVKTDISEMISFIAVLFDQQNRDSGNSLRIQQQFRKLSLLLELRRLEFRKTELSHNAFPAESLTRLRQIFLYSCDEATLNAAATWLQVAQIQPPTTKEADILATLAARVEGNTGHPSDQKASRFSLQAEMQFWKQVLPILSERNMGEISGKERGEQIQNKVTSQLFDSLPDSAWLTSQFQMLSGQESTADLRREVQAKITRLSGQFTHEAQYTNDGGLTLLWPFIPVLFRQLALLTPENENVCQFISPESQAKAYAVLRHLLGSAHDSYSAVANLFVGYEADTVVSRLTELSDTECETAGQIFSVLIAHWQALKNMPPSSIQQMFLQRQATIKTFSLGTAVSVQKQAVDVLMQKLPWGLSMIRFPWLNDRLISVEWR